MLNIFGIQRPQWKNHPAAKATAAHLDPADFFADDEDLLNDMYQDVNIPDVGYHEAGTTASEFDGAPDEAEDLDEDKGVEAIEVDESDEEPKHKKSTKKVRSWLDLTLPIRIAPERVL